RTYALVGAWERDGWDLPDGTHTVVETFEDGWAWSVPISATVRHVGVMVGPPSLIDARLSFLLRAVGASAGQVGVAGSGQRYSDAIAQTIALRQRLDGAVLRHAWACDA